MQGRIKLITVTLFLITTSSVLSYDLQRIIDYTNHQKAVQENQQEGWFVGAGLGLNWQNVTTTSFRIYYTPYSYFDHYALRDFSSTPVISIDGGYHWMINDIPFAYYLGIRYQYVFANNIKGDLLVMNKNQAGFNYNFGADLSAHVLQLFTKIDLIEFHHFLPFVTVSAGVSDNVFSNYSESPQTSGVTPKDSAAFTNKSRFDFSYSMGFGLDYALYENWLFSVQYEYVNFGEIMSGQGAFNHLNSTYSSLNFGELASHSLLFQVNYLFN